MVKYTLKENLKIADGKVLTIGTVFTADSEEEAPEVVKLNPKRFTSSAAVAPAFVPPASKVAAPKLARKKIG